VVSLNLAHSVHIRQTDCVKTCSSGCWRQEN